MIFQCSSTTSEASSLSSWTPSLRQSTVSGYSRRSKCSFKQLIHSLFSYENDPDLFNFDYKTDLINHARLRERVFTLNQFAPMLDEEGNLLSERKPTTNVYANASSGTGKSYDSGPAPLPSSTGNSGFNSTPKMAEEEYAKPEKTSYPENEVGGRF